MKIPDVIKQPTTWIWVIAAYLIFIHLFQVIAIFGPIIFMLVVGETDNYILELKSAVSSYLEFTSSTLNVDKTILKYAVLYSGISSLLFLSFSPQLGMRKNFARLIIILLIAIELLVEGGFSIYYKALPNLDENALYVTILIALLLPNVSKKFMEDV